MKREKEIFQIAGIHRDDLIKAGFDGDNVDDATMERLASKMGDDYIGQLFWDHIGVIAQHLGIPVLQEEDDTEEE